jgi:dihydropteroate synthase
MQINHSAWSFADGGRWELGERTRVLGILNVTTDSFSDGGIWFDRRAAVARGLELAAEGADAIDVGGESTRPGSLPVPADEELRRVVPVIRELRTRLDAGGRAAGDPAGGERIRISVDTMKASVAEAAIEAGADIVNDVSGLRRDPAMAPLLARAGAAAIVMHMRGEPRTMQDDPSYDDLMGEIEEELRESLGIARAAGIQDDRIALDPGIGFGKTAKHNFEILARLQLLAPLGRPLLVGVSRKSFLGKGTGLPVEQRLEASLAAGAAAVLNGAAMLRVHDVAATVRMVRVIDEIRLIR